MTFEEFSRLVYIRDTDSYIWLHQEKMDVGGGKISREDIDRLREYDHTERVMISGLRQDTFEYFVNHYGRKINYIYFHKNKCIEDFSILSELTEVKYIQLFHNQRASKLWDMSSNYKLEGLCISDFTRLHSLDGVQTAPNLKYLYLGDAVWSTSTLTDLKPLINTNLTSFIFDGKAIEDKDISVYSKMPFLKVLTTPTNLYTTEELAQIVAACPHVSGRALAPYLPLDKMVNDKDVLICGKRKPFLNSKTDAAKIEAYVSKFNDLVERYKQSI